MTVDVSLSSNHVQILLALYNGSAYLAEQLDSLASQTHADWSLLISDDASKDAGPEIAKSFAAQQSAGKVGLIKGPCAGAAANFLHLLRQSDPCAAHLAFCDQDDVWMSNKLSRAVAALTPLPADLPAFYCSRTQVCDAMLAVSRKSRIPRREIGFRNALVQNVAAGNTMVMNRAAADLARSAAEKVKAVVVHDWWLYQIVTGAGGAVVYDNEPSLYYRQHSGNTIGAAHGFQAGISRFTQVLNGGYRDWNDINVSALVACSDHLTEEHRGLVSLFADARRAPLPRRLAKLQRTGVYRQGAIGNAALWISALLGRL